MSRSQRVEWLLRIVVFGSALAVGILGAYSLWQDSHDYGAALLFALFFAVMFASLAYVVKKRKLGMLETR